METLRLYYNKIRIFLLKIFTERIKVIDVKDKQGRVHRVTTEKVEDTVCDHKNLKQIHHILWQCTNKKCELNAYFFIPSKILCQKQDIYDFLDTVADSLGEQLNEKNTTQFNS